MNIDSVNRLEEYCMYIFIRHDQVNVDENSLTWDKNLVFKLKVQSGQVHTSVKLEWLRHRKWIK